MPGTVKIWWHDGATTDVRHNDLPVVNEPELGFETVSLNGSAISTGPAPNMATVAVVESDVDLRYYVRRPGDNGAADPASSKPMPATGAATDVIGIAPGCSISFIEI